MDKEEIGVLLAGEPTSSPVFWSDKSDPSQGIYVVFLEFALTS